MSSAAATEKEILLEVVEKTAAAYREDSSVANLREWNAAKAALKDYEQSLKEEEGAERFKNIEQAAAAIVGAGYITSTRTVRNHAGSAPGFPKRQKDGGYLKKEIEAYAQATWENPSRPSGAGTEDESDHKKRFVKEQADKLALANAITRRDYILRSEVEQRCASAAAYLKKDLGNFGPRVCDRLIEAVSDFLRLQGVDLEDINLQSVTPDLLEEYDKKLDAWLDRYAQSTQFSAESA